MLSPLKTLLTQFFNLAQDAMASDSDAHTLQLATVERLAEVIRLDVHVSDAERVPMAICHVCIAS